jgi:hypothetical protein
VAGYLYYLQDRRARLARSIALGHLLLVSNYIGYIACWRAFYRILCGRTGWDKTKRQSESARPAAARTAPLLARLVPAQRTEALPAGDAGLAWPLVLVGQAAGRPAGGRSSPPMPPAARPASHRAHGAGHGGYGGRVSRARSGRTDAERVLVRS